MKKAMFEELLGSVREGGAILRGKERPSRKVVLATPKVDKSLIHSYSFTVRPLSAADGGGFAIEFLDLPGWVSDGSTPEEAVTNGYDAVEAYLLNCTKHGNPVPKAREASGQWRQRVPRSLHARLVAKARREGVSLNTLVTGMISEGLACRTRS